MDAASTVLTLAAVTGVVAAVVWPFFAARRDRQAGRADHRTVTRLRQRADLLAARNSIYHALQELDFDRETNKVSDEDYAAERYRLVAQGVAVLQRLDALPVPAAAPESDPIEAAVMAYRGGASAPAPSQAAGQFCPTCGAAAAAKDKFCGACGARLD
jgi:hypothetical protein